MNEIAVRFAEDIADEANTIVKYTRDMIAITQENAEGAEIAIETIRSIIAEELKHILMFAEGYSDLMSIAPEDYEVVKDDEQ